MSGRCWKLSLALGTTCALPFFDRGETKLYGVRGLTRSAATDIVTGKFGIREPAANCAEIPLDEIGFGARSRNRV